MSEASAFDDFVSWLRSRPGDPPTAGTWERFAREVEHRRAGLEDALLAPVEVSDPGETTDFERWGLPRRLRWNLNALRVLRAVNNGEVLDPGLVQRSLRAYTGWGGFTRVLSDLPAGQGLFDPATEAAVVEWRTAHRQGRRPDRSVLVLNEDLRTQYFTPPAVCGVMWSYALRLVQGEIRRVLEPSAGIGRMLDAMPVAQIGANVEVHAVEYDPTLAGLLRARWASEHVSIISGPFEGYDQGSGFDVVIGNPPFMDRAQALRRMAEPTVGRADHFAMLRSLELLRPGGVCVALTPASLVQGVAGDNVAYRSRMLRGGDLRGAVLLPAACFPSVPNALCVQVWTRRATARSAAEADRLAAIPYEFPESNILGQLVDAYRGQKVSGDFDPVLAEQVAWEGTEPVATVPRTPTPAPARTTSTPPAAVTPTPAPVRPARTSAPPLAPHSDPADEAFHEHASVQSLGARLALYYHRIEHGQLTLVEVGRNELLTDLAWHEGLWGRPDPGTLSTLPPGSREGWLRYEREGVSAIPVIPLEEPPRPGSSPFEAVSHFCRINGFCSEENLDRYFPGHVLLLDLIAQGVMLEPDPQGGFFYFTEEHFLTGDLSTRLSRTTDYLNDRAEQLNDHPEVLDRLRGGVARLEAVVGSTSVLNLGISARSSLVPQEIRAAWVASAVHPNAVLSYDGAYYSIRMRRADGQLVSLFRFLDIGFEDMSHRRSRDEGKKSAKEEADRIVLRAVSVLGFLNRQTQVDIGGDSRRNVFAAGTPFMARDAAEKEVEEGFHRWLTQPEQAAAAQQLEAIYNDRIHRQGGRLYSTEPMPLSRQNPNIALHAHQNQTVRWQIDRVGGFQFDCVGGGKTFAILASIVSYRQSGRARRIIIDVPVPTLAQWYFQARVFLPDYRIALIGMTTYRDKHGRQQVKEEDQVARAAKWAAFRQGFYDILIVGHQGFLNDVYPSTETIDEIMADQSWLQRGLAKKAAARLKAEKQLEGVHRYIARYKQDFPNVQTPAHLTEQIEELEETIRLNTPKDKEVLEAVEGSDVPADGYRPKDAANLISWDDIGGPDVAICVDEAHTFKNLWAPAARLGATIAFLGATEKKKAGADDELQLTKMSWDLLFKCNSLSKSRGDDQGILLATATPYSNSPIELYNLGCYLSPRFWPDNGIEHKEEFIDAFLDIQEVNTASVMTLEGHVGPGVRGFKKPGPLARLLSILAPVMQRRTKEDLTVSGILKLPTVNRENIVVPMTGMQLRASDAVRAVAEERIMRKIRKREGAATEDDKEWTWGKENALTLALMGLLSDVSLDPRLLVLDYYRSQGTPASERLLKGSKKSDKETSISEDLAFVYSHIWETMAGSGVNMPDDLVSPEEPAKYTAVADRVLADWRRDAGGARKEDMGKVPGVLIFFDAVEAHDWFIEALVARGIKRERIAVISGAVSKPKRDQIALDYNGRSATYDPITHELIEDAHVPKYDVLIGNSRAMATGLNLQRRTAAIYHVTYTWEPATIEQREGRGVRQGNTEGGIWIYNVMSEKSFDGILVNTSQGKSEWQNEVFPGIAPVASNATGMDREEALIQWVVRDPAAAQKLFLEIRERQRRENETRVRLLAWRIWSSAYANIRQVVQGSPRAPQILAGVRYTLENSPRAAIACLPTAVVETLMSGGAAYPDLDRKVGFFYGGNRMTLAGGETEDVLVIQAHVTDRAVALFHRKRGSLEVTQTRIFKPGGGQATLTKQGKEALRAAGIDVTEDPTPFPGVVACEPIPWSRREEARSLSDVRLSDVFLGCLETTQHPRRDRELAVRIWGLVQDDPTYEWGQEIKEYHTPAFQDELSAMGREIGHFYKPSGRHGYSRASVVPFMLLDSGILAVLDTSYYSNYAKRGPVQSIRPRRLLTPRDPADRQLLEQAVTSNVLRSLRWDGSEQELFISGGQQGAYSHAASQDTYRLRERIGTVLWSLYVTWGYRASDELVEQILGLPQVGGKITLEMLIEDIGQSALPLKKRLVQPSPAAELRPEV